MSCFLRVEGNVRTCSWLTADWRERWRRWWCKVKKNTTPCWIKRTRYEIILTLAVFELVDGFCLWPLVTRVLDFHEAESAPEGLETSDGRSGGGDRPAGARQEEVAERAGWAAGGERAAAEPAQRSAERDQVSDQNSRGKAACGRALTSFLCGPGVRAPLPRCSTPWMMTTTTTTTSAPMGRRISAHRQPISARLVRRTSSQPSICEARNKTAALTLQVRQFLQYYYSQVLNWSAPYSCLFHTNKCIYCLFWEIYIPIFSLQLCSGWVFLINKLIDDCSSVIIFVLVNLKYSLMHCKTCPMSLMNKLLTCSFYGFYTQIYLVKFNLINTFKYTYRMSSG